MTPFREGQQVRATYRGGTVEGRVLTVREEPDGSERVVIDPGKGVELDTAADRVVAADRCCPVCDAVWDRPQSYRCPECGADLVDG